MVHNILYYIVKEILKRTLVRMLICCVIALLFCITGNAKVPYIPKIINYSVSDYKAGNQNWAVSQGPGGKMYIGNNRGLLVFDGIHWDLVKLPNNLGVRALYISKDGRIYVGSFEEFGYFEMDDENDLIYNLLLSFPTAALGGAVEIPTIDGKVKVKIDSGTQPGKVLRLRGKGLTNVNGYGTGDLLVNVSIYVPEALNKEEKSALEKMEDSDNFKPSTSVKEKIFKKFKSFFD